jgi:hypothetical protein
MAQPCRVNADSAVSTMPALQKTNWILTPGKLTESSRITSAR